MQHRTAPSSGFDRADEVEAVATGSSGYAAADLVRLADFLSPELHRNAGAVDAAAAVSEWAEGDATLLAEAEAAARRQRHHESAELLHRAVSLVTAA